MKRRHCRTYDPILRTQPWKVMSVFDPIERVLHRMEMDGTIDAAGGVAVFHEDGRGGWYEIVPAIDGVVEFHHIARDRYALPCDTTGLERIAKKLNHGAPIFGSDLDAARASILSCKRQALNLRQSQASDIIETVRISMALEAKGVLAGANAPRGSEAQRRVSRLPSKPGATRKEMT